MCCTPWDLHPVISSSSSVVCVVRPPGAYRRMGFCHEYKLKYDPRVQRQVSPGCKATALHYKPSQLEGAVKAVKDSREDLSLPFSNHLRLVPGIVCT